MTRKRLISITHFHPELVRGGAQQAAYELFQGFDTHPGYEAYFLAGVQQHLLPQLVKPKSHIFSFDARPNEFLMAVYRFDAFWQSNAALYEAGLSKPNAPFQEREWGQVIDFFRALRPDIIHFNHSVHIGIEMVRAARVACPNARIIYTLHDFVAICHASGHMVRTKGQGLCEKASPSHCSLCFPDRSPGEFFLRDRWLRAHFSLIDRFIAPSMFLRERYIAWGIPKDMIELIDSGRTAEGRRPIGTPAATKTHNRFGFFGQLIDSKGIGVLIDAVQSLVRRGIEDFEVRIHGANLNSASEKLQQKFKEATEGYRQIKFLGSYFNHDLPRLAATVDWFLVPSIWWENSPLVIQEGFMARRPVITGNIGGMAEKVRHNIDGLHFSMGDPEALADVMTQCIHEPGLWEKLSSAIPEILSIEEAVEQHRNLCFENVLPSRSKHDLWEAPWADQVRMLIAGPEQLTTIHS